MLFDADFTGVWTPINKAKPEQAKQTLISNYDEGWVTTGYYNENKQIWTTNTGRVITNDQLTHWSDMPKPPYKKK